MELRQLQFFLAAAECGSLGKAAEKLYTSQPNVSKTIQSLEAELGEPLFVRTTRGLRLTTYGKQVLSYAESAVKNAEMMRFIHHSGYQKKFMIATYQSNMLARLLVQFYKQNEGVRIEHWQGTIEEVIRHVAKGLSEIGFVYIPEKKYKAFIQLLGRNKLTFQLLKKAQACVYAGPHAGIYDKESVSFSELKQLRYIECRRDYFSLENEMEHMSMGLVNDEELEQYVITNSEHLVMNMLRDTELVQMGINLIDENYLIENPIRNISIEDDDAKLYLGYIYEQGHSLSEYAQKFLTMIQKP